MIRRPAVLSRRTGDSRGFSWGFASQGFSSATNLGLSLMAGRLLGPSGLGVVAVVFTAYLTSLGFLRALVSEPLVTATAALSPSVLRRPTSRGLTVALCAALAAAVLTAVVGVGIRGQVGRGLLLVAPWLPFLLIQDYWRSVLFRDGRARVAAINDFTWVVAMGATAPVAWAWPSIWSVVAVWGIGGFAGAMLGIAQTRLSIVAIRHSLSWWRDELWPLGRWLAASSLGYAILSNTTVLVLVLLVGTSDFGGLRAVNTVFAPLTFVGAALALPGLPALSRARSRSEDAAIRLATQIGVISILATAVYIGVVAIGGTAIIADIFGHSFANYGYLVWPVAVVQLVTSLSVGYGLVLKAQRRGSAILVNTLAGSVAALAFMAPLGAAYGLTGIAWGAAGGAAVSLAVTFVLAMRVTTELTPRLDVTDELAVLASPPGQLPTES